MAPLVVFPDAQLVALTYLRPALTGVVGYAGSEPPGPDELPDLLPVLVVEALRPPNMPNRWALAAARLLFTVIARDQPTANHTANLVNAHVRAMSGATITLPGGTTTVSTVQDVAAPESGDDSNPNYRTAAFSAVPLLRPLKTT